MVITGPEQYTQHHLRRMRAGCLCVPEYLRDSQTAVADYLLRQIGIEPVVVPDTAGDDLTTEGDAYGN